MSNKNFNCDVCGREVQGITIVNGMKFCSKCYQETFGGTKDCQHIEHKSQKNAQKVIIGMKQCDKCEYYLRCEECCVNYDKTELIKLKQQLAEKEKEQNQKAIDQLLEVKEFIYQKLEYLWNSNAELTCIDRAIIDGIYEQINKQIDELNGDVEE